MICYNESLVYFSDYHSPVSTGLKAPVFEEPTEFVVDETEEQYRRYLVWALEARRNIYAFMESCAADIWVCCSWCLCSVHFYYLDCLITCLFPWAIYAWEHKFNEILKVIPAYTYLIGHNRNSNQHLFSEIPFIDSNSSAWGGKGYYHCPSRACCSCMVVEFTKPTETIKDKLLLIVLWLK